MNYYLRQVAEREWNRRSSFQRIDVKIYEMSVFYVTWGLFWRTFNQHQKVGMYKRLLNHKVLTISKLDNMLYCLWEDLKYMYYRWSNRANPLFIISLLLNSPLHVFALKAYKLRKYCQGQFKVTFNRTARSHRIEITITPNTARRTTKLRLNKRFRAYLVRHTPLATHTHTST